MFDKSKNIVIIIRKSQKQVSITAGGFVCLDVATALMVSKTDETIGKNCFSQDKIILFYLETPFFLYGSRTKIT